MNNCLSIQLEMDQELHTPAETRHDIKNENVRLSLRTQRTRISPSDNSNSSKLRQLRTSAHFVVKRGQSHSSLDSIEDGPSEELMGGNSSSPLPGSAVGYQKRGRFLVWPAPALSSPMQPSLPSSTSSNSAMATGGATGRL